MIPTGRWQNKHDISIKLSAAIRLILHDMGRKNMLCAILVRRTHLWQVVKHTKGCILLISFKTLRLKQNGCDLADIILKYIIYENHCISIMMSLKFLAATKQLYELSSPSVCLSVCPSVCHTFLTMFPSSYHLEIFRSYYQWQKWRPRKRSRSEVKGQGYRSTPNLTVSGL